MKNILKFAMLALLLSPLGAWASGIVRNVTMRQIQPWNGLIEIGYELTSAPTVPEGSYLITQVTIKDLEHGTSYTAKTFTTTPTYSAGAHRLIWNAKADGVSFTSSRTKVAVVVSRVPSSYCVVDLSGGTSATTYPVSNLNAAPAGGWTDEYKTTKLVLRRIEPGTFTMGDQVHGGDTYSNITLTKPFYIGVFEVTQRQWELVMGTQPSYFHFPNDSDYSTYPVEQVSYNMIRGSSAGAGWPASSAVDATSFLGKLRAKTGIAEFDLPTEAQWEYAARSGTTTDFGNGTNYSKAWGEDSNMSAMGRYGDYGDAGYSLSGDDFAGPVKVGSYAPNKWGLYDMHGNVWEWCLDWHGSLSSGVADPQGSSSGSRRVLRGGSWSSDAGDCTSGYRSNYLPASTYCGNGFRLSRTLSK